MTLTKRQEYWLRPPEVAAETHDEATSGPCWYDTWSEGDRLHYVTDAEASALSGVPERSLLVLQDADIIRATQAPKANGGYKRVWHVPEVARATILEEYRRASGSNYRDCATNLWHAAFVANEMLAVYCGLEDHPSKLAVFAPELHLAPSTVSLFAPKSTQVLLQRATIDDAPELPEIHQFDENDFAMVAALDRGEWKAAVKDEAPQAYERVRQRFYAEPHVVVLRLSRIFRSLEIKAKQLRT